MKKSILTVLIALILVIAVCISFHIRNVSTSAAPSSDKNIKIGLIVPLTGTHKAGGESMEKGVKLAVNTINSNGGVSGTKLSLIIRDDKNDPSLSKLAAKDLIENNKVNVIIGPYSSECTLALKNIINQYKVPLISPVAMANEIITGNDYMFRNTLSIRSAQDKINECVAVNKKEYTLLDGFHAKTIGLLWQNDSWGKEMQRRIVRDLKGLGRDDALLFNESFDLGTSDFKNVFKRFSKKPPDVIYVISSGEEAISIVSQGRDSGYKGLFYGEGGFNYSRFDEILGKKAEGCLFTSQWHPSFSTPMSDVFIQLYNKEYNATPDMFAAISYEAVYILQDSLKRMKNPYDDKVFNELLQEALSMPKKVDGLSGTITFDESGQCDRPMFILQKRWDGEKIQSFIVYPSQYAQGDLLWNFDK